MILIEKLMSFIAPPNCLVCGQEGAVICGSCTSSKMQVFGSRCYVCSRLVGNSKTCPKCVRLGGPSRVWINYVYASAAELAVESFKFNSSRSAGRFMAAKMAQNLPKFQDCLIVPVPTATTRIRQRGFDHTKLLAREISRIHKAEYLNALRHEGQARQVGSTRRQRLKQAENSYRVKKPNSIAGRYVLLIDDVSTTGATLQAAAKVLRKAGAKKVDALVFAKRI